MKICMFLLDNCKWDGRVLREAKALTSVGHSVVILALLEGDVEELEEKNGIIIRRFPGKLDKYLRYITNILSFIKLKSASEKLLIEKLKNSLALKVTQQIDKNTNQYHTKVEISYLNKLARLFKTLFRIDQYYIKEMVDAAIKEQAEVCHAHDLNTLLMAYNASKKLNAKLIYDSHELFLERNLSQLSSKYNEERFRCLERNLIKKCNAVITVSESVSSELGKRYNIAKPKVIMNCAEKYHVNDAINLRNILKIDFSINIAIYIGGIIPDRGLEQMIESVSSLNNVLIAIIGYGKKDYIDGLKKLIEKFQVLEKVRFLDPVEPEDVSKYMSGADVGMVLNQNVCMNHYVTIPNRLFQCIQGGLPIVASDFPELRRIVEGHNIGKICKESDPRDIAKKINDILSDKKLYSQMKENLMKVKEIYNWENESKKLQNIYSELKV